MDARTAYITLNMMDGIGPVKVRAMIDALGSPEAILSSHSDALRGVKGIGPELARRITSPEERPDAEAEIRRAGKLGARIVTFLDDEYPARLKEIHDPPLALYVRGTFEAADRHSIAIVGSRRTTLYGRTVADRLAYQLAKAGLTVVSGLARGIDTAAHEGALKGGGRTGAVIGSALDHLYPPENRALSQKIEKSGYLMSEFPLGTEPGKTTFPMRNRIVSGICVGIIVVEAGRGSGALITANQAMEQGRIVFAVPGRIDAPTSRGCHDLLKQGARLVDGIDDVLEELEFLIPPERKSQAKELDEGPTIQVSEPEEKIVRSLWNGPLDVDDLSRKTGLTISEISMHLITLEMKRVVRMRPGRIVELAEAAKPRA
jgi:DNA processing protein